MSSSNLYFIDSRGQYRLLRENVEEKEIHILIQHFLNEHNFKSYYTRSWNTDEGTMYDVGSHTEFFLWGNKND
jgi:predicted hydrolase (HD superfamily)